jgi:hypothetical protein
VTKQTPTGRTVSRAPSGPATRAQNPVAKRDGISSDGALFAGGGLALSEGVLRDAAWAMLSGTVQERLRTLAGRRIEWWAFLASDTEQRPTGFLLGESGFAVAEPAIKDTGKPVYRISGYSLDPASFRHIVVDERPRRGATGTPRSSPSSPGQAVSPPVVAGLSRADEALLGSLPAKAQRLLAEPFLAGGERVLRSEFYYEGTVDRFTMFVCVLAGPHTLTAATGTRQLPVGAAEDDAHWSLVCRRASVLARRGS